MRDCDAIMRSLVVNGLPSDLIILTRSHKINTFIYIYINFVYNYKYSLSSMFIKCLHPKGDSALDRISTCGKRRFPIETVDLLHV